MNYTTESLRANHRNGRWLVLAAAVLWGTTGTAQALAPGSAAPATVGATRLAIGGLALLALAAARGALRTGRPWPRLATLLAAGCMAGYQPLFFAAVASTGVAAGTIVAIGSAPVFAGALGFLLRAERPGRRWAAATALAIIGCGLLASASSEMSVNAFGVLLALGAGACYAAYAVVSKGLLELHPPDTVMAVIFCLGAILLSPVLLQGDLGWLTQARGLAAALHLGLAATALAYTLFARGLRAVPAATAVSLSLAEPLTAGVLGVLVLGESLPPGEWLGGGLLLAGLAILAAGGTEGNA
ncbi:MAG: EamA family transporter [Anaerolineales bacterium]|nr:EamA family transporter [Anaerolineales bacterium]